MTMVQAPFEYEHLPHPWVFLAGSIEMGAAEQWQEHVAGKLDATVLNPRRDDWDNSWKQSMSDPRFVEQVMWELLAQQQADLLLFYFSPGTNAPITLLELGLALGQHRKSLICCPPDFYRHGNVDITSRAYWRKPVSTLEDLIRDAQGWIRAYSP